MVLKNLFMFTLLVQNMERGQQFTLDVTQLFFLFAFMANICHWGIFGQMDPNIPTKLGGFVGSSLLWETRQ